jgi:hypothetical protein
VKIPSVQYYTYLIFLLTHSVHTFVCFYIEHEGTLMIKKAPELACGPLPGIVLRLAMISRSESDLEQVKRSSAFDALGHKQGVSEPLSLPFRADVQLRSLELNQALDLTYHLSGNP